MSRCLTDRFIEEHQRHRFIPPMGVDVDDYDYRDFAFLQQWRLPWFSVLLENFDYAEMLNEARAIKHQFVTHRPLDEEYGCGEGWRSICLHGLGDKRTENWERYSDSACYDHEGLVPYGYTKASDLCPVTSVFFKRYFPFESYQRIRFMLLEPGGYILPHVDRGQNAITSITLALNNPVDCNFVMESCGSIPLKHGGDACIVDVGREHAVYNGSDDDRYHIIVHGTIGKYSDRWRSIIKKSYLSHIQ